MNSLERVPAAVNGQITDKIPIAELAIDETVIQQIMLGASRVDFYEEFDIDGFQVIYVVQYEEAEQNLKRDFFRVVRNFKVMHGFFPTPVEPHIKSDMDPLKLALWKNIDCSHLLPFGSTEDVRKATIVCIKKAGKGGGYILSFSNTIHSSVPAENFMAMVKTAREHRKYPLEL